MPDILDKMSTVDDIVPWLRWFIYGPPGVGKTILACSAPTPMLLDVDNSSVSLRNHPELRSSVQVVPISSYSDAEDVVKLAREDDERLKPYSTMVLDNITELRAKTLDSQMTRVVKNKPGRDKFEPSQAEYAYNNQAMRALFIKMADIPKHIIITAYSKTEVNPNTGSSITKPAIADGFAMTLEGLCVVVGYLTSAIDKDGEFKSKLQVRPTASVYAKTRLKALPNIIENPTFNDILTANEKAEKS